MHLAKRLNEELAQQNQSSRSYGSNRAVSPDTEPRSKSYDHKSAQTKGNGIINIKIISCSDFWYNCLLLKLRN